LLLGGTVFLRPILLSLLPFRSESSPDYSGRASGEQRSGEFTPSMAQ